MLSPLINTAKQDTVHLDAIRLDGGTQPRGGINDDYVAELVEALQAGVTLPPVDIMYDGEIYWLFDGFHRVAAHRKADFYLVPANIHQGTQADAQWRSYAANQTHGLRRSNEDKQRAIKAALRHPNGAQMPDREIARHLGVDHKTVGGWREKLQSSGEIPQMTERTVTRDGVQYAQNTANIGANQPPRRHIYDGELERIVVTWAAQHYPGDWPENPSHTNGTYWQQLTAHLRATITTATWHESDLKAIIKRLHAQRIQRRPASPQSPISEPQSPTVYKSLAQMDADGDIPPLGPPSPSSAYSAVHPIQNTLRPLTGTYTAADLRTTANYRGGSRWFEARRLLQDAGIHYRDRDLVQALNNLADELEQRERTLDAKTEAEHSDTPAITTRQAADILRPTIDEFYTDDENRRYRINDMRAGAQSTIGGFWLACERTLANYRYTAALLANAIRLLADELEQSQPAQPSIPSTPSIPSAPSPEPDDRINRARILINHSQELRTTCEDILQREREYEALVGTPSDLLAAHRGMHAIVDTLPEPIAKLQHLVETLITTRYESR